MQVKKQQLEPDMEQQTGLKIGKEVCQGCILSPAYLTYMHRASLVAQLVKNPYGILPNPWETWVWKILWKREKLPTSVFWPEEFHGQRSLAGYSPWGHKELDIAEWVNMAQSTSCKMQGWMKHKLKSRLLEEISITSDMQMKLPLWQKAKRTKEPFYEDERGKWKSWQNGRR